MIIEQIKSAGNMLSSRVKFLVVALTLVAALFSGPAKADQPIQIKVTSAFEVTTFAGLRCALNYQIQNNYKSTLYGIRVLVYPLFGSKTGLLMPSILTNSGAANGSGYVALQPGESRTFSGDAHFQASFPIDSSCDEITGLKVKKVENRYCSLRNLGNNTNCIDLVSVTSADDFLEIN